MSDSPSVLDIEVLRSLVRRLESTDVDELEVEFGSARLYIRREPGRPTALATGPVPSNAERVDGSPLGAPLTGVFYTRPGPDQPPFVEVGTPVAAGQVVGLIETMKLFNEVISDMSGEVTSLDVQDGDLVQAGQPLMHIRMREAMA